MTNDPARSDQQYVDALDFTVSDFRLDLENLDALLNVDLDGICFDLGMGTFRPPTRARYGVLVSWQQDCGAMTRKGKPCRARAMPGKKRCKYHGGASTGPKTAEGRKRIAEAQRRRWAKWRTREDVASSDD